MAMRLAATIGLGAAAPTDENLRLRLFLAEVTAISYEALLLHDNNRSQEGWRQYLINRHLDVGLQHHRMAAFSH